MEQLRVIGSEGDALILATESGQRFTLPVDTVLRNELKRGHHRREPAPARTVRSNPRDIQSRVRAGMSAPDIAEALGITVEDVARYEGPVLAEREHVVGQALAVAVLVGSGLDDATPTFGSAVRAKLAEASAVGERWTSWKDESGWTIKLEFTASDIDHDARWAFDPRRSTLVPLNTDATQLSRQGPLPEGLIPRLRALDAAPVKDDARFDSGAFGPRRTPVPVEELGIGAIAAAPDAAADAAIKRAPEQSHASSDTADLLEALRRRRGQRAPLPDADDESAAQETDPDRREHEPVALFDALEPGYTQEPAEEEPVARADLFAQRPAAVSSGEGRRKGRTAMPSWDEIVFGARGEES